MKNNISPFNIAGKKILITGASGGIGRSIAIECSKLGAHLIITGRNEKRLTETFNQLAGINHLKYVVELQLEDELNSFIDKIETLNGIVHVAGITHLKPFNFLNENDINNIMKINFFVPALISNSLIKKKKIEKNSSIVFISSISGNLCSFYGNSVYSASKAAVNGLVKGMALDLAKKQIRVNSVMPGMIDTEILKDSHLSAEELELDKKKISPR